MYHTFNSSLLKIINPALRLKTPTFLCQNCQKHAIKHIVNKNRHDYYQVPSQFIENSYIC